MPHLKSCANVRCGRTHHRLGQFCSCCERTTSRSGNANGRLLTKGELQAHRKVIRAFLKKHADHPGVIVATAWAERLLNLVGKSELARSMSRLRNGNVSPTEVLEAVGAVYLIASPNYFRALPDDERTTFNLANAVLRLRPGERLVSPRRGYHYRRPSTALKRTLGQAIRTSLGVFFEQVTKAIEAADQKNQEELARQRAALASPFPDHT